MEKGESSQTRISPASREAIEKRFPEDSKLKQSLLNGDLNEVLDYLGIKKRGIGNKAPTDIMDLVDKSNSSKQLGLTEGQRLFLSGFISGATEKNPLLLNIPRVAKK